MCVFVAGVVRLIVMSVVKLPKISLSTANTDTECARFINWTHLLTIDRLGAPFIMKSLFWFSIHIFSINASI